MDTIKPKVMIIDDDPAILRMAMEILKEFYTPIPVPSGSDAIRFLIQNKDTDIILLDINMDHMNGFQVIDLLKNQPTMAHIPVVFFSSTTDKDIIAKGIKKGAIGYVLKPFTKELLLEKVSLYLKSGLKAIVSRNCVDEAGLSEKNRLILYSFMKMDVISDALHSLPPKQS